MNDTSGWPLKASTALDSIPQSNRAIAEFVWNEKYRFKNFDGVPIDLTVNDTWHRVADALASVEPDDQTLWAGRFYDALADYKFLPAGRIISGAGTGRDVALPNCFVNATLDDSLSGIFDGLKRAAMTMRMGGGVGTDFSALRFKGAEVSKLGAPSSGPLSFMDCFDVMCSTIMSAGARRGAQMGTMRCDHPDVLEFIDAKRDAKRFRNFNLSVTITDAFMKALRHNDDWPLKWNGAVIKTVKAKDLWDRLMLATYEVAEPGVIFIDRINKQNNLSYCETIESTNPCVAGDTPILTHEGYIPIEDAVGRSVEIWNGEEWSSVKPYSTGVRDTVIVTLSDGTRLRVTDNHEFCLWNGWARDGNAFRKRADELVPGDKLQKFDMPVVEGGEDYAIDAYSQGFYSGDGSAGRDDSFLYWTKYDCANRLIGKIGNEIASKRARVWKHGPMFDKAFVPIRGSIGYCLNWLAGILDADGTLTCDKNGSGFQIGSVHKSFLLDIKLMLSRLGVLAKVVNGADGGIKDMPGGNYFCQPSFRLLIGNTDAISLLSLGLRTNRLQHDSGAPQRDARQFIRVLSVEDDEPCETYCFTEPKAHRGTFNGVVTGQCSEQPLPPNGACVLGSINLARLVLRPFETQAQLPLHELRELTKIAVRMLDNVISASRYPLAEQELEAHNKRRVGLGVTGVGDALAMCRLRYGSEAAQAKLGLWTHEIMLAAYEASVELAKEKGAFPLFDKDKYCLSPFIRALPDKLQGMIFFNGIRNALITSIAPTGTISLFAGNVSSGIEPIFAYEYERKVLQPDGSRQIHKVIDYAVALWRDRHGDDPLPDYFVTADDLTPKEHLLMQAAAQPHVDSSISKTVNCPRDISFDDFKNVYSMAYDMDLKCCATYRPNEVTGSVLSTVAPSKVEAPQRPDNGMVTAYETPPAPRLPVLSGRTYKIKPNDDHAIYVTVNNIEEDGKVRPYEVFINSKNMEHFAWCVALTRMISAVFRRGGNIAFVVEELKAVFDPRGGHWHGGSYVPSVVAAIGNIIDQHMLETGCLDAPKPVVAAVEAKLVIKGAGYQCPKCGQLTYVRINGCNECSACGYTKCS